MSHQSLPAQVPKLKAGWRVGTRRAPRGVSACRVSAGASVALRSSRASPRHGPDGMGAACIRTRSSSVECHASQNQPASRALVRTAVLSPVEHRPEANWLGSAVRGSTDGQPSQDLRDLCSLQLGVLQTLLRSSSSNPNQALRAAVYMRVPGPDSSSGTVLLQRVAATPPSVIGGLNTAHLGAGEEDSDSEGRQGHDRQGIRFGGGLGISGVPGGAEQSVIMLQLGAHGELQSGDGVPAEADVRQAESCLVSEEVLVLPSSGSLVLPLVDGQSLVGLMLVEPAVPVNTRIQEPPLDPQGRGQGVSSLRDQPSFTAIGAPYYTVEASSSSMMGSMEAGSVDMESMGQEEMAAAGSRGASSVSVSRLPTAQMQKPVVSICTHQPLTDGHYITPGPAGIPTTLIKQFAGFSDAEIHALRAIAPVLAKSCAMELRAAMRAATTNSQAMTAARLLRETARPASALNTFAAMLMPRLEEGTADRDLVKGIKSQGKRLQDLLRQIDAALTPPLARPPPLPRPPMPLGSGPSASAGATLVSVNGRERVEPAWNHTAPQAWAKQGTAIPAAPPSSMWSQANTGTSQPVPIQTLFPPQSQHSDSLPTHPLQQLNSGTEQTDIGASTSSTSHMAATAAATSSSQQAHDADIGKQPQLSLAAQAAGLSDTAAQAAQQFSMLQAALAQPVTYPDASPGLQQQQGPSLAQVTPAVVAPPPEASPSAPPEQARTFMMRLAADSSPAVAADGIIDMEPLDGATTGPHAPANRGAPATFGYRQGGSGSQPRRRRPPSHSHAANHTMDAGPLTDLAPALLTVLTAAAKLATATGILFSVQHPLKTAATAATAHRTNPSPSTSHVRSKSHFETVGGRSSAGASSSSGLAVAPQLKPPPARPLHVAVAASALHRIVAYVVDLALQCTPQGGSVAVSARSVAGQGARWVELIVAHTGFMVTQRLHSASTSLHSLPSPSPSPRHHTGQLMVPTASAASRQLQGALAAAQPVPLVATSHLAATGQLPQQAAAGVATRPAGPSTGVQLRPNPPVVGPAPMGVDMEPSKGAPMQSQGPPQPVGHMQPGGPQLSFSMAEELIVRVGGHLRLEQPAMVLHGGRGTSEPGTRVIIQLPVTWAGAAAVAST